MSNSSSSHIFSSYFSIKHSLCLLWWPSFLWEIHTSASPASWWRAPFLEETQAANSQDSLRRHRLPEYALEGPCFEGLVFTQKKKVCLLRYLVLGSSAAILEGFELTTFQYRPLPLKSAPTESDLASLGSQQEPLALTERRFRCDHESNQRTILQSATPHGWCRDVVAGRAQPTEPRRGGSV